MQNEINVPNIVSIGNVTSLNEWLKKTEAKLKELGYDRLKGHHKDENFGYWKTFEDKYQIAILFYDFREYGGNIGTQFECLLCGDNGRHDFSVSNRNIDLEKFESMAKAFLNTMSVFNL